MNNKRYKIYVQINIHKHIKQKILQKLFLVFKNLLKQKKTKTQTIFFDRFLFYFCFCYIRFKLHSFISIQHVISFISMNFLSNNCAYQMCKIKIKMHKTKQENIHKTKNCKFFFKRIRKDKACLTYSIHVKKLLF